MKLLQLASSGQYVELRGVLIVDGALVFVRSVTDAVVMLRESRLLGATSGNDRRYGKCQ